jgi:hypothetical protein
VFKSTFSQKRDTVRVASVKKSRFQINHPPDFRETDLHINIRAD